MRVRERAMPPEKGTEAAASPEAIPRGTTGTRYSAATRTTAATSSVDSGRTATSGSC